MKTLLVATDFSRIAQNTIEYAAEIAQLTKAKLILFHVYHVPVITAEVPVIYPTLEDLEKDRMDELKKTASGLLKKYGNSFETECVCKCGFVIEEINLFTSENKVDLIVMGMQGVGYLTEKLIGSTTTALIREAKCPVLAIGEKVKFRNIKKIVLACDYEKTENAKILEPLREIAELFKSHIYILNVFRDKEKAPEVSESVKDFISLESSLADTDHTFHYMRNDDVVNGINNFITEKNMDMVVMIPRRHSLLKSLFQEKQTRKMAFHSEVPLLALHE
ncbi:MAG: universal stress protein [Bacteroidia bacterium]